MPAAASGRDTFHPTGRAAAVVSVLPGHKKYLHRANPSVSVSWPALPAAMVLAGCTKGGICFSLFTDMELFACPESKQLPKIFFWSCSQ